LKIFEFELQDFVDGSGKHGTVVPVVMGDQTVVVENADASDV